MIILNSKMKNLNFLKNFLINYFIKKNNKYFNLINNIKKIIFNNNKINFFTLYLVNDIYIYFILKNKELEVFSFYNKSYINFNIYIKKKNIIFKSNNLNIKNIKFIINNNIYMSKYIDDNENIILPEYNLIVKKNKNLKLFHPLNKYIFNNLFYINNFSTKFYNKLININNINLLLNYKFIISDNTYNILKSYSSSMYRLGYDFRINLDYINNNERRFIYSRYCKFNINFIKNILVKKNSKIYIKSYKFNFNKELLYIIFKNDIAKIIFFNLYLLISNKNFYKNNFIYHYLNKKILPKWISIIENPLLIRGIGSSPFNKNGIKNLKIFIVKHGILKNIFNNNKKMYNWIFKLYNKNISFNEILNVSDNILLITNFINNGFNINNGYFFQNINGFYIKNKIKYFYIKNILLSINILEILNGIIYMSNDFNINSKILCGSFLIKNKNFLN